MKLRYYAVSLLFAAATAGAQASGNAKGAKSPELRIDFTQEQLANGL
ncbi:MAG: hypothetical protein H0T21_10250, partial [Gemmatimonadaceae bacterium]|nr:hypothetical protein [Gemmatimonadaceae bacterium]